jgi:hypothetical protein
MFDRTNGPIVRSNFQQTDVSGKITNYMLAQQGVVPAARLDFATDASNNDTITIGGHVFKFLTTLVAADTFTQVQRGTSAAATLASLVNAINGTSDTTVVQATTPFALSIVADAVTATKLRIRKANARGGSAIAGTVSSTTLAESLTPAASIWNCADLNVSGKSPADYACSISSVTVTAAMVTNGSFQVEMPFTPTVVLAFVKSSTGVQRASTDAVTISSNAVNIALAGGASPAIQATDIVTIIALA